MNLPDGWYLTNIDEAVLNVNGARKPVSLKVRESIKGEYPYYGATGQIDSLNDFTHEGEHILIGEDGANLLSKSKDLAFIVDGQFWVNNHAHAVKCLASVPAKFVASYINSLDLSPWVSGSAQPKLTKGNLEKISIPFPPLAEQKVITDKLDTLLAQVETTKAGLDRIPQILKTFRQSVLASAVSGKLSEEWRINAKVEWPEEKFKLRELIELAYGKALPAKTRSGAGFPVYGSNGSVGLHKDYLVDGPFIVVGRKGSNGEVTWSDNNGWPIDTTYFVNLKKESNLRFIFFMLQTLGLNQLNRSTAIPGLNREDAYAQLISIPDIREQTEIVRRVEQLFAFADSIEKKVNDALDRVNNLTQSILAKAFRGELTADWRAANSKLVSGDNSAQALLANIKAERKVLSTIKKNRLRKI